MTSNPSPRYVKAAADAFASGAHTGGLIFSGKYGDLGAMVAAILLDQEARSPTLELDPTHGLMREPVLKVMHVLRAMEYTSVDDRHVELSSMQSRIGQFVFESPSVFNFYLPEYTPPGPVMEAGLVAPEAQICTTPNLISFLNGMVSLVMDGLTSCWKGFGWLRFL